MTTTSRGSTTRGLALPDEPRAANLTPIADVDFDAAVSERLDSGGVQTRNLLGQRTDPDAGGGRMDFRAEG